MFDPQCPQSTCKHPEGFQPIPAPLQPVPDHSLQVFFSINVSDGKESLHGLIYYSGLKKPPPSFFTLVHCTVYVLLFENIKRWSLGLCSSKVVWFLLNQTHKLRAEGNMMKEIKPKPVAFYSAPNLSWPGICKQKENRLCCVCSGLRRFSSGKYSRERETKQNVLAVRPNMFLSPT